MEAYFAFSLAGGGSAEARSYARASAQLADAITHKRTATPKDARLAALAADHLVRFVALIDGHELSDTDQEWQGVYARNRYFAWDGPTLHKLDDRQPIPAPLEAIEALRAGGHKPLFGSRTKLANHQAGGAFQVFETDRETWRRELLQAGDAQILMVRPGGLSEA